MSRIRGKIELINLDYVEAKLELTMNLACWKQIAEDLDKVEWNSSSGEFKDLIRKVLITAQSEYYKEVEVK